MALAMALPVLLLAVSCAAGSSVLGLRGGIGPRPADNTAEYYSQFDVLNHATNPRVCFDNMPV